MIEGKCPDLSKHFFIGFFSLSTLHSLSRVMSKPLLWILCPHHRYVK